jgi:hypothetical protein
MHLFELILFHLSLLSMAKLKNKIDKENKNANKIHGY